MKLRLIRSATLKLNYNGRVILIDPYLAAKHDYDPLVGKSRNPMFDLPCTPEEVIEGVELVIVSHLHFDHFDKAAWERLPKTLPLYCQPGNEEKIKDKGFEDVRVLHDQVDWNGIRIIRTAGQHGKGMWAERMGQVSGFVFQARGEPTIYWTGDTIWYEAVEKAIHEYQPDVIVTHSCGAEFDEHDPIVMDAEQTVAVCRAAPNAIVIATHMDTFDHGMVTRADLRAFATAEGITAERLRIPDDGETLAF
jgi:L-ascorbate metabolism protein UlaG (beta-lactamase superfamily)